MCGTVEERLQFPVVVTALEEYLSSYSEEASAHGYNQPNYFTEQQGTVLNRKGSCLLPCSGEKFESRGQAANNHTNVLKAVSLGAAPQ